MRLLIADPAGLDWITDGTVPDASGFARRIGETMAAFAVLESEPPHALAGVVATRDINWRSGTCHIAATFDVDVDPKVEVDAISLLVDHLRFGLPLRAIRLDWPVIGLDRLAGLRFHSHVAGVRRDLTFVDGAYEDEAIVMIDPAKAAESFRMHACATAGRRRHRMSNAHVLLAPVAEGDLPLLYALFTHPTAGMHWRYGGLVPSFEVFLAQLRRGAFAQLMAIQRADRGPIGLVTASDANFRNGTVSVGVIADAQARRGAGIAALALFIDWLFWSFPFRQVQFDASDPALDQYRSGLGRIIDLDGTLKDHDYLDGHRWDHHLLSISRTAWSLVRKRRASLFAGTAS